MQKYASDNDRVLFKEVEAAKYFLPADKIAMAGIKNDKGYQGAT
jgi:hypothetical protein